MSSHNVFTITRVRKDIESSAAEAKNRSSNGKAKVLLVKPPYFTPWTPPLGIAIIKSFLEQHGFAATCFDFNTDPDLWSMHHKYFAVLQTHEDVSINDGYSKLWWILNAHMLAYSNGADAASCSKVLKAIIPFYGISFDAAIIKSLLPLVEKFYKRLGELIDQIDLSEFMAVGTSTYTTSLGPSLFFLRRIKQNYPRIKTVMGGGVFADDMALGSDNLETLIEQYDFVDHILLGEGELTMLKLLEGELSHKRVISLADLNGEPLNMKEVPSPNFSDLNLSNYYHLTIEGARSCPFQCSFCSETIQWGDYRKKPAELFADQVMELASRYNNKSFFLGDSLMNPYIFQFSNALLEKKADILYDGYLRADKPVMRRDKVKLWAHSGLYRARLGIESAATNILNAMDKMTTPKVISEVLKSLASAGIRTTTYWIVGFPGETEEDFQETCDFIQEHHRYIYELEAHPYYYYPYGQIGSRLYQCYSLYPEDVTEIIKFKAWDIINASPTREERYDRLRRISKLAADLSLPNIYTMAERYEAEDRWQRLHPLTREVYEETRMRRPEPRPPDHPIDVLAGDQWQIAADLSFCYRASVNKRLNEETLSTAIDHLVRFNEALRMRLQESRYVPLPFDEEYQGDLLAVYSLDAEGEEDQGIKLREIISAISRKMAPPSDAPIRVALIHNGKGFDEVLLLAHRANVDSKSVTLLFEDLFRIYEQLSNGMEISLRPPQKGYFQFLEERLVSKESINAVSQERPSSSPQTRQDVREVESALVVLDKNLKKRIFSATVTEYGLTPQKLLVMALIKALARAGKADSFNVDVTIDYRSVDATLEFTVGALTETHRLPDQLIKNDGSLSNTRTFQEMLADFWSTSPGSDQRVMHHAAAEKETLLLNLEFFVDEPWLGGDDWAPQGFAMAHNQFSAAYFLEIVPMLGKDVIEVHLAHQLRPDAKALADEVTDHLVQEVEAILEMCERYMAAKDFWVKEFSKDSPRFNFMPSVVKGDLREAYESLRFEMDYSALSKLQSECDVDEEIIILAAYYVLLSRLNGAEDLAFITSIDGVKGRTITPLRLWISWDQTFAQLAQQVKKKTSQSLDYAANALEILSGEVYRLNGSYPIFDIAYMVRRDGKKSEGIAGIERALGAYPAAEQCLSLTLEVVIEGQAVDCNLTYRIGVLERATANAITNYLTAVVQEAASNVNVRLEEIMLAEDRPSDSASESLAGDAFQF